MYIRLDQISALDRRTHTNVTNTKKVSYCKQISRQRLCHQNVLPRARVVDSVKIFFASMRNSVGVSHAVCAHVKGPNNIFFWSPLWSPHPLMWGRDWPPETHCSRTCVVTNLVALGETAWAAVYGPKIWINWAPDLLWVCMGAYILGRVWLPGNTSLLTKVTVTVTTANFVTQDHWNRLGLIGYLSMTSW